MAEHEALGKTLSAWVIKHRRLLIIAGLVLVVLLLGLPIYATRQPQYFKDIDGIKPYFQTWKTSTHEKMNCVDCHIEPGADNLLYYEAKAVGRYYLDYARREGVDFFENPTRKACQQCHTTYRVVSASGDLLIPHQAHVEVLHMSCPQCHQALVHTQNTKGINTPKMEMCLKCHDGHKASAECKSCHTEKAYPRTHRASDWLDVHSEKAKDTNCAKCHAWTPDFCQECHAKRPKSHAGNWKKLHAGPAKIDSNRCMVCHQKKKCLKCHDEHIAVGK